MKKALLIGIFSLLALAPVRCALAQSGSTAAGVKASDKSAAGTRSSAEKRKAQDLASETPTGDVTARNQTTEPTLAESTGATSNALPNATLEAQKRYNSGVALYDSGKLGEAIIAFKDANKLKPNDPQTQYMLGMVYWKAKAFNNAVGSFKRAVRLRPDWAEAHFRLGLTYYVLGRKSQTNEAHKKLLELNSPLADKLNLINKDANPTNEEKLKVESGISPAKQTGAVPLSGSAAVAPINEKPRATTDEFNSPTSAEPSKKTMPAVAPPNERVNPVISAPKNAPTTAASSDAAATPTNPVTRIAGGDPAPNNAVATPDPPLTEIYKVGAGDVLDIRLLNSSANRSTLFTVNEGGMIDFPIAGGLISVAGLTTKDIQERITSNLKRLAVDERTQVAVGVRHYASHTVIITGLVGSPGTKILRREAVPLYVLLAEVQPRMDAARAVILRAGAPTQVVELSDSAAISFIVRPGDVVNVMARPQDFYYISGRIRYPGQKTFQPGITLVQAILAAGGLARDSVVELSREGSDGRLTTTKFKLKEIKAGEIEDPKLQPGDRIEVFN